MKKIIILMLIVLFMVTGFVFSEDQEKQAEKSKKTSAFSDTVTKTYFLEHVSPSIVQRTLAPYIRHCFFDRKGKIFTVIISKEKIPTFEKMLKKLDVEKKKILIRIFTVIASRKGKSSEIENKDLKQVLNELEKVLSFKSFRLDGVSALTVTDGQRDSKLLLSSESQLELELDDIYIKGEKRGERTIAFEFRLEQKAEPYVVNGQYVYQTLIESETSVKENGYLVAGVSKIGNGDSLVLVLNAEIK